MSISSLPLLVRFLIRHAAIGFGDKAIHPDWKMIAAIEGINGVILIGWSTAFFVTMMGKLGRRA